MSSVKSIVSKLHAVPWGEHMCGSSALSALLDKPPTEIEKVVAQYRVDRGERRRAVKCMYASEISPVVDRLGGVAIALRFFPKLPTFVKFVEMMQSVGDRSPYLVLVTGHFLAYQDGWIVDTTTGRKPVPAYQYEQQNKRVVLVWKIARMRENL